MNNIWQNMIVVGTLTLQCLPCIPDNGDSGLQGNTCSGETFEAWRSTGIDACQARNKCTTELQMPMISYVRPYFAKPLYAV